MAESPKPPAEPGLEKAISRLEEIVAKLESGEVDLEKSIDLYAEAVRLGKLASTKLEAIERRIELVTEGADGNLRTAPFPEAQGAG